MIMRIIHQELRLQSPIFYKVLEHSERNMWFGLLTNRSAGFLTVAQLNTKGNKKQMLTTATLHVKQETTGARRLLNKSDHVDHVQFFFQHCTC